MVSIIKYNTKKRTYTGTNENDVLDASILNYEPIGKTNIKKNLGLIITGGNGDDKITGTDYNDTIKGGNGNDRITGGLGVDNITGGAGITTINYSKGDGNDIINLTKGENFTLNFTDLTIDDLRFEYANKNKDLRIYTSKTSDEEYITLKNFAKKDVTNNSNAKKEIADTSSVELVVDGKTYDLRTSKNLTDNEDVILYKTTLGENAKNFTGTWLNDEIDASGVTLYKKVKEGKKKVSVEKEENDTGLTIKGGAGNDTITGTKYSDKIYGNKGNDTINAGTGNNYIYFNKGDGHDIIENGNGIDTLVFAKKTTLSYSFDKYDLIVKYSDKDTVTLKDYFKGHSVQYVQIGKTKTAFNPPQPTVEESQEDGYTIFNGSEIADTITGTIGKDKIYGNDGNDTIDGRQGENICYFKTGDKNDIIKNGLGTDTIVFSENQNLSFIHNMSDNDLILLYGDNDSIVLKDYYVNNSHSVKNINNNGTIISLDTAIVQNNLCKVYEKNYNSDTILVNNSSLENFIYTKNNNDLIITFSNDDKNTILLKEFLSSNHAVKKVSIDGALSDFKDIVKLYFEGTSDGESITGTDYDDTITANQGNDTISGGNGKNTYIFNQNDGNDTILKGDGTDTIKFNQEVDIRFSRDLSNSDLVLNYGDNDSIRLQNYYTNNSHSVKNIINGAKTYTLEEALNTYGTDITGSNGANNITGTSANDTIIGGRGADIIDGGSGNNIYVFNTGDGTDTIINGTGVDTIKFNITQTLTYTHDLANDDLVIGYGNSDSIVLKDYFKTNSHSVDTIINNTQSLDLITELSKGMTIIGTSSDESIDGTIGDDIIRSNGGADIITGGKGTDKLYGGSGNSTYVFSIGDGHDEIYSGNGQDTIVINNGTFYSLNYEKSNNDLIINYSKNDRIILKNYFSMTHSVKNLTIGGKTELLKNQIKLKINDSISCTETSADDYVRFPKISGITDNLGLGDDEIQGCFNNSEIYSGEGNDRIEVSGNGNTIYGGKGNDYLSDWEGDGEYGSNTYIFNNGDGDDTIELWNDYQSTLNFTESADFVFEKFGNDLIIRYNSSKDSVRILKYYDEDYSYKGNSVIEDKNGTRRTIKSWLNLYGISSADVTTITGTLSDDYVKFSEIGDITVNLGLGDDALKGRINDSEIYGGEGNDRIEIIGSGNTIYGGKGNDYISSLEGETENNTVVFNNGDGDDTVSVDCGTTTILKFADVNLDTLSYEKFGSNLIICYNNKQDSVTVNDYFYEDEYYLPNILLQGKTGDVKDLNNILTLYGNIPNANINTIIGTNTDDYIRLTGINKSLTVNLGIGDDEFEGEINNSKINGGEGNDKIEITGDGNIVSGGKGNDYISSLEDETGNNTVVFNNGDGDDTVSVGYGITTLKFADVNIDTLSYEKFGSNLIIHYNNKQDSVTVNDYFYEDEYSFTPKILLQGKNGTTGELDNIIKSYGNIKDISSNTIIGTDYDDTITANTGGDTINGGKGNNTYVFNLGDGSDTIINGLGNDTIKFKEEKNLSYNRQLGSNDLIIGYSSNDSIRLKDYFVNNSHSTKRILNGEEELNITEELLNGYNLIGTSGAETFNGTGDIPFTYVVKGGNDTIKNSKKTDTIEINTQSTINYSKADNKSDLIITYGTNKVTIKNYFENDNVVQRILNGEEELNIKEEVEKILTIYDFKNIQFSTLSFTRIDNNLTITDGTMTKTYNLLTQVGEIDYLYVLDGKTLEKYSIKSSAVVYRPNETTGTYYNDKIIIDKPISTLVDGKNGRDVIINESIISNDIHGDDGNDTITNEVNASVYNIYGDDDNDKIYNYGAVQGYISGGGGQDYIYDNSSTGYISGGDGGDYIEIGKNSSTGYISGDDGNDKIYNYGTVQEYISGGDGGDSICIYENSSTGYISGGDGGDSICIYDSSTGYISGGDGDDFISTSDNSSIGYISGDNDNDKIYNYGTVQEYISGGDGDDRIYNYGSVQEYISGGDGDDYIATIENATGYIKFGNGDGNDTLELYGYVNKLSFSSNVGVKTYSWNKDDLVIKYNDNQDSVTIKDYNPNNTNIVVMIGTDDKNYVNLATLVSYKPVRQTMSLGTSNTRISELSAEVLAFTSTSNSDMQLNYTTPDTNDISVIMSEYTNTDLQGSL